MTEAHTERERERIEAGTPFRCDWCASEIESDYVILHEQGLAFCCDGCRKKWLDIQEI